MEPKALYNSLRVSYLHDPNQAIDSWKVEDLRKVSIDELFSRLKAHDLVLDRTSFLVYANEFETPEELAIALIPESAKEPDQLYLLMFELWRRIVPEKQSISLICDELDYQISQYDSGEFEKVEALDDAFQAFYTVLEESVDSGLKPEEAFSALSLHCAHDIGQFLYDYISELIDMQDHAYAQELIERYYPFILDKRYFELLQAELELEDTPRRGFERIRAILLSQEHAPHVALNIDILTFLSRGQNPEFFCEVAKKTIPLLSDNDDLEEFLQLSKQFFTERGDVAHIDEIDQCAAKMGLSNDTKTRLLQLFAHKSTPET